MTLPAVTPARPDALYRLPLPKLGRPNAYVRKVAHAFRRAVEQAMVAAGLPVGVAQASRVHTATLAMAQTWRIGRILATAGEPGVTGGLTHEQWLAYSDRMVRYKEAADKALAALGLDTRTDSDPWEQARRLFDAQEQPAALQAAPQTAPAAQNRPDGHLDAADAPGEALDAANVCPSVDISGHRQAEAPLDGTGPEHDRDEAEEALDDDHQAEEV